MSISEIHIYKRIFKSALTALATVLFLSHCARPASPQGGPRDTLPPAVISATPAFGTTNFTGNRIVIEFNEYIQLKDQQKEFYISPAINKKPNIALRGRGIQVDFQEPLSPNQTYSLNFGKSIVDNNEGNPNIGLRYVFSTGDSIDSDVMSGYTVNANKNDSIGNVFIMFYEAHPDSTFTMPDSTLFKKKPSVISKSFGNGIFFAENLKSVPYRIYAFEDNNTNQTYEAGVDRVAFLDSTYNPAQMPSFDVWYDTIRMHIQANPQMQLRLFMDKPYRRQVYTGSSRPLKNKIQINFTAPKPEIEKITLEGIDASRIQTEYTSVKHDTMFLWIDGNNLPDTIKGSLTYMRTDSIGNPEKHTQSLSLQWREPAKREKKRNEGNDQKEPNPFAFKSTTSSTLNPEKDIAFTFEYPLVKIDSSAFVLENISEKDRPMRVKSHFIRDTAHLREWHLRADWKPTEEYQLYIPPGALTNSNGESNDSITMTFKTFSPEKYGVIILNVKGESPDSEYVLQLLNNRNTVLSEIPHVKSGEYTLNYVDPSEVKIRVIQDKNSNGLWDGGSLAKRIQPERVETFVTENGTAEIVSKANWELAFDINMESLFAPITMERLKEDQQRREVLFLKNTATQRTKKIEEDRKNKDKGQEGSSFGGSMGGGMGTRGGNRGGTNSGLSGSRGY